MAETATPEKTPPKGVLPKNLQTWILAGIALLVTAVIFFSGGGSGRPPTSATPRPASPPEGRPKDLTSQVSEALAQQEADQARAQQDALVANQANLAGQLSDADAMLRALSQGDPRAGGLGPDGHPIGSGPAYDPNYSPHGAMPLNPEMSVDEETRRQQTVRAYTSLFASQVARSYRPAGQGSPAATSTSPALPGAQEEPVQTSSQDARIAQLDQQMAAMATQSQQLLGMTSPEGMAKLLASASAGGGATPTPAANSATSSRTRPATTARNQVAPASHHYVVIEGSVLEAILITRLAGDFSGPVLAQLSAPVYSRNMQHVLLPAGTRIIGEARRVEQIGQTRLAVAFHRVVTPDGYSVDLDLFEGISSRGETALRDQVNNHYRRIFGTSIALGLLGGLSAIGTSPTNPTTLDTFRMGTSSSLSQSASEILNKLLNILPTVTIREGHRMRVWIAQDLALPAYDQHRMPGDL